MRGRFLILIIGLNYPWIVDGAFHVGLLKAPEPIAVNRVASVNENGLVFSRALGEADFKRYHWGEFSLSGTQTLMAELPGQSVFRQKNAAEQGRYMDLLRGHMLKLMPTPEIINEPTRPAIQPPVQQIVPLKIPEPPVIAKPAVFIEPESVAPRQSGAEPEDVKQAIDLRPLPRGQPPLERKIEPVVEAKPAGPFQLIPGPAVSSPVHARQIQFGAGVWFSLLLVVGLSVFAGNEVATYRRCSRRLVCLLSAVCPIIVPIVYLVLPEPNSEKEPDTEPVMAWPDPIESVMDATHITEMDTRLESTVFQETRVSECYRSSETRFSGQFFADYLSAYYKEAPNNGNTLVLTTPDGVYPVDHISDLSPETMSFVYPAESGLEEASVHYRQLQEVRIQGEAVS